MTWNMTCNASQTASNTYQCGHSENLDRQRCDGYTPLMVIIYEVFL